VIKNVTQIWSGYKLQYGVFQISGAVSDPSICEVFFVLSSEKHWKSQIRGSGQLSVGTDTDLLENSFKANGENFLLGYLLLSKQRAETVTTNEISRVMDNLMKRLAPAISFTIENEAAGSTTAGSTTTDSTTTDSTTTDSTTTDSTTTDSTTIDSATTDSATTDSATTDSTTTNSATTDSTTTDSITTDSTTDYFEQQTTETTSSGTKSIKLYTTKERIPTTYKTPTTTEQLQDITTNVWSDYELPIASSDEVETEESISSESSEFSKMNLGLNSSATNKITTKIKNFYFYTYDGGINSIKDGGSDMYDTGNQIKIKVDEEPEMTVDYNKLYKNRNYMFISATSHPFYALLYINSPDEALHEYKLSVSGNAGADGSGNVHIFRGNITDANCTLHYDVFELSNAGDPSICEVFCSIKCKHWESFQDGPNYFSYINGKNDLSSAFTVVGNQVLIGYMLLSKSSGEKVNETEIENALEIFLDAVQGGSEEFNEEDLEKPDHTQGVLEKALSAIRNETAEQMRRFIPNFFSYSYDSTNQYSIDDGGNDMFDGGNTVYIGKDVGGSDEIGKVKYDSIQG